MKIVSALAFVSTASAFMPSTAPKFGVLPVERWRETRSLLWECGSVTHASGLKPMIPERRRCVRISALVISWHVENWEPDKGQSNQLTESTKQPFDLNSCGFLTIHALSLSTIELPNRTSLNLKQDFLEASPYYDQSAVITNVYKNKAPFTGKIVSTKRIVGPKATGETCHIIIDHNGDFPYWEGQSWGVIPPGVREKDGKPHAVRLYSIASSRYGDDMTGKTGSLCVRRATYWCPELQAEDPAKKGICSNFLCDTQPGDEVMMTGPAGKVMLMPEEDPNTDYIMVATGTGIAPFRGFVRRLFFEDTPAANAYKGEAWLFLGVANSDALLYDDEFQDAKARFPENFRLDYALSREQENKKGGKMYIQDKVEEYADEVFNKLDNGAHIYFCGLKGMMPGIQDMLAEVCKSKGLDYEEWIKGLKAKKQWHVEVY
ncbi:hypothetical protein HJC23_000820 [Cyclotella cryptica]|uniref:ferredoxin--NADP(+) reductase n=1 Tax=Cyclotella cryptica TaxID=29204 RepID=A0ABD3Q527_9STRA